MVDSLRRENIAPPFVAISHVCVHAHAQVMEAENSITLTSENVLIALGWHSENDYGFS